VSTEFRIRRKSDGALRHCLCHAQTIRDDSERMLAFVGTVFDVTERMELELQLRQAQKMEALGRLAGGVAHEFNNLLTVILGHAQLLGEGASDERRAIVQAAQGAGELTRHLLSFSRQTVRAPVVVDVDETVATVGKLATRVVGNQIQVITERAERPCLVRADANQLQQLLLNLALNAKDAMPAGGILRLRTSLQSLDPERAARMLPNARAGAHVLVEVSDSGVGMDARTKARIFEPFFTTKPAGKGTGLGLAIVYGAVRQSGGVIDVESEPGQGTTFRIYLPADAGEATPPAEIPPEKQEPGGTGNVMIIEDDVEVGALIARILGEAGYTVQLAHDMCGADELWRTHGATTDLLITDVVMPERGGVQTARLFTEQRPGLRVLFMSGYAPEDLDQHMPHDWLEKPFSPEVLLARVRATLA
jgi:two-component system cell cycle sensor histidine kinase/response regulator CckA